MSLFDFHFDLGAWSFPFFKKKPKTILIVEDDLGTIAIIRRAAESFGFFVEHAATAEEALGILHTNGKRFVLALLDVNLPSMSGWALLRLLNDQYPTLPVVIMSGAPESFDSMPTGIRLSVMIKPSNYGQFFQALAK